MSLRVLNPDNVASMQLMDLWPFVGYLGKRFSCTHVLSLGAQNAAQLAKFCPDFGLTIIAVNGEVTGELRRIACESWVTWDPNLESFPAVPESILDGSVIVCTSLFGQIDRTDRLFQLLRRWMEHAPVCLLTAPLDLWKPEDFCNMLESHGFNVAFTGLIATDYRNNEKDTVLAIIERNGPSIVDIAKEVPPEFRVVAIMTAYNEEDIIVPSIRQLIAQGVEVYLIDNWSTDRTHELASELLGNGLIGIERYPVEGPTLTYKWGDLLKRVEELALTIKADWFIHHDVDEIRVAPWPSLRLREALYVVDRSGYNCIDHIAVEFKPVDNGFVQGMDFGKYFRHYVFGSEFELPHLKAWKNLGCRVDLAGGGGHDVRFDGRRIFPYKFLIKHYPIRSQAQGEKKVFKERKSRWDPIERSNGWHVQYDDYHEGNVFFHPKSELKLFEEEAFCKTYLIERLSGIAIYLTSRYPSYLARELYSECQALQDEKQTLQNEKQALQGEKQTLQNEKLHLIQELAEKENTIQSLSTHLAERSNQLEQSNIHLANLESEIFEMRRSVIWQLVMKFHNGFVEHAMPLGTSRRRWYDSRLKSWRARINKGWRSFLWNSNQNEYAKKMQ